MKLSKTTLKNIEQINKALGLSLRVKDELVNGVYKIYEDDKMLGVINFKEIIKPYQFEDEFACQTEAIKEILKLKDYKYFDWITSYPELNRDSLKIFSEDDERLLIGSNTFGYLGNKESYEFNEDYVTTTLKNRNIYLDYLDIEEEKERISKELLNMIGSSNVTVYTDYDCKNWYIVNGLEIEYIDVLYKDEKDEDESIENLSWFLSKENEDLIERVATYLDYELKKLNIKGLFEKYIEKYDEYEFLGDESIQKQILAKLDFSKNISDIVSDAENLIEQVEKNGAERD